MKVLYPWRHYGIIRPYSLLVNTFPIYIQLSQCRSFWALFRCDARDSWILLNYSLSLAPTLNFTHITNDCLNHCWRYNNCLIEQEASQAKSWCKENEKNKQLIPNSPSLHLLVYAISWIIRPIINITSFLFCIFSGNIQIRLSFSLFTWRVTCHWIKNDPLEFEEKKSWMEGAGRWFVKWEVRGEIQLLKLSVLIRCNGHSRRS